MANTKSADFERSSSQSLTIDYTDQTGLGITGNITVECWIKPESFPAEPTYNVVLVENIDGSAGVESYSLRLAAYESSQRIQFFTYSGASDFHGITYINSISTTAWTHLAGRFNGTTWKLFKNGTEVSSSTDSQGPLSASGDLGIGANPGAYQYYDGLIDEVRIWNTARSQTQISANKDKQLTGSETGLKGYWRMNNDFKDETSNDNDLTNNNSVTFSTSVPFVGTSFKPKVMIF